MTRTQRHWHARIWLVLPFLLALALGTGLLRRGHGAASLSAAVSSAASPVDTDRGAP